jgi:hypothetical protein
MVLIVHYKSAFLKPATPKPKGWSMKQSDKAPFFEKGDGGFVLRRITGPSN